MEDKDLEKDNAPETEKAAELGSQSETDKAVEAKSQSATDKTEELEAQTEKALAVTNKAIELLKTVYDPEIPVNVYDLGLIYKIDFDPSDEMLHVDMTLTAPSCPAADFILEDVRQKLVSIDGTKGVDLRLVFEPEWNQDMMTEEAKLELGFL